MIKTKVWITIFGTLLVLCAGSMISPKQPAETAHIYHNGECIHSVDLSRVTEPYELPVEDENGANTIRVEPGRICVASADCPDQTCVHMGWSTGSAIANQTIVCLPHRLVIQFEGTAFDAAAG